MTSSPITSARYPAEDRSRPDQGVYRSFDSCPARELWQDQGTTMPVSDSVLLVFLAVAAVIHIAGITILGFLLRESLRITRAVGALVVQEEEKTRRLVAR